MGVQTGRPGLRGGQVMHTSGRVGPGCARQLGIDAARGDLIALLDDDDRWFPDKLEKQLRAAPRHDRWILSCRYVRRADGQKPVTIPARLIQPHERVAAYLMTLHSLNRARPSLAVPTLMFPKAVAEAVPLSETAGSIHDDPMWLMKVQRTLPDLAILQLPECLVEVNVTTGSISRPGTDRSQDYIDWGTAELAEESRRVRGDYQLYSPVSSALAVGSLRGVARSVTAGVRVDGRASGRGSTQRRQPYGSGLGGPDAESPATPGEPVNPAPTVTVITITLNDLDGLKRTVDSVRAQRYPGRIRHIVVDRGSGAEVLDYLSREESGFAHWQSGLDEGRYDAMNQGIAHATGDVLWFLHSSDCFADAEAVDAVVKELSAMVR